MGTVKALSKQLLGAHYEHVMQSIFVSLILFLSFYTAKIRVVIAPFILFVTATGFSGGVMLQALSSDQNAESKMGFFLLPFDDREMTFSYVVAFGIYTLVTKSCVALAVIFAVERWNISEVVVALICACNGCMVASVWYIMQKQKRGILILIWLISLVLSLFLMHQLPLLLCCTILSIGIAIWYLSSIDPYLFYRPEAPKTVNLYTDKCGGILVYLLRYLIMNRVYIVNTLGIMAIACFLPFPMGQITGLNTMPLGIAILCMNTPIGTILSSDRGLEQAIRTLPGQTILFCSRYFLFLCFANISSGICYLISWQILNGDMGVIQVVIIILFAMQSALFTVLLEWIYPIRNWKIENDLWHHPRKYIVPLLMMMVAVMLSAWPFLIWIWIFVLAIELLGIYLIGRRI